MRSRWPGLFLLALCLPLMASGKRGSAPALVSFHLETSEGDYPKFAHAVKMGDPAQQYYFKLSPALTDGDVQWFYPFLAADGVTYGTAFKMGTHGSNVLQTLTSSPENQGKLFAVNVMPLDSKSSPMRDYLQIDRRIDDGVVVIWQGLTDAHLRVFAQRFPHVRDVTGG